MKTDLGIAFTRRFANRDGVIRVGEVLEVEFRILWIVIVTFRFMIVADHELEKVSTSVAEHRVVLRRLFRELASCGEAGDVRLVKNRPAAHALKLLKQLVWLEFKESLLPFRVDQVPSPMNF